MDEKISPIQKILLVLMGAVTMGVMWRTRGEHGWGSSWGVLTAGVVFALFIYYAIGRKRNASFFQIGIAGVSMMLTTPAWGPILNQINGRIESTLTDDVSACTPASGIFMMLCMGFATVVFFAFFMSRLFSSKEYKWYHYIIVIAVPMAVYYVSSASVSHFIVGTVQPEIKAAITAGIQKAGLEGTPYTVYLKHFNNIAWAKKHLEYGRTYFTEIAVVSRAIAAAVACITVRFGMKDKVGGRITALGCGCMSIAITVPDLFFMFAEKYPDVGWLDSAWSFWEYFTGFIFGALFTIVLLIFNDKTEDSTIAQKHFVNMPRVATDIFHALFTFIFTFCLTLFRPIAERFEANDKMRILTYIVSAVICVVLALMMILKKVRVFWRADAVKYAFIVFPVYFGAQMVIYLFSGDSECIRNIYERGPVLNLMIISYAAFYLLYIFTYKQRNKRLKIEYRSRA